MIKHLDIAYAQLGITETPGADATPQILRYFAAKGRSDVTSDETAWCAAFAGWVCTEAGYDTGKIAPAESLLARSYLKVGVSIDVARIGALAVFKRDQAGPHAGHVGFVVGVTSTHIILLGGNQGNAVSIQAYPKADLLGLRWIVPETTVADLDKTSRIAKAAARQQRDAAKVTTVPPGGHIVSTIPDLGKVTDGLGQVKGLAAQVTEFAAFVGAKWWLIALALGAYWGGRMAWDAWQIRAFRLADANDGKTVS